jgi:hypothetical protein
MLYDILMVGGGEQPGLVPQPLTATFSPDNVAHWARQLWLHGLIVVDTREPSIADRVRELVQGALPGPVATWCRLQSDSQVPDMEVDVNVWCGFADVIVSPDEAVGMSWINKSFTISWQYFSNAIPPFFDVVKVKGEESVGIYTAVKKFVADLALAPRSIFGGQVQLAKRLSPYALGILGCYGIVKLLAYGVDRALRQRMCDIWRHVAQTDLTMIESMEGNQHQLQPFERPTDYHTDLMITHVRDSEGWFTWVISAFEDIELPRFVFRDYNDVMADVRTLWHTVQFPVWRPTRLMEAQRIGMLSPEQTHLLTAIHARYNADYNHAQGGWAPFPAVQQINIPNVGVINAPADIPIDIIEQLERVGDPLQEVDAIVDGVDHGFLADVVPGVVAVVDASGRNTADWTVRNYLLASRNAVFTALVGQPLYMTYGLLTLPWRMLDRSGEMEVLGMQFSGLPKVEWDYKLLDLLRQLGLPQTLVDRWSARMMERNARRRVRIRLLRERDLIFKVRGLVMNKIGREQLRENSEANRLVVSRCISTVMEELKLPLGRRAIINDACIEACFIDTMYDVAGQELLLGPGRRPV